MQPSTSAFLAVVALLGSDVLGMPTPDINVVQANAVNTNRAYTYFADGVQAEDVLGSRQGP
ncbi:hypothetical protein V2A60_004545 [Cordyceps javanica]